MKKLALIAAGAALAIVAIYAIVYRLTAPPYEDVYFDELPLAADPTQVNLPDAPPIEVTFERGAAVLYPQAAYRLAGKVCGLNHLKHSLYEDLIPYDLCTMWGRLATEDMRGTVTFKHDSLRFSWYHIKPGAPVDQPYVGTHFSNSHLLCADENLRRALGRLGRNDEFELTGYLINAHITLDGQKREWNTSMIRTDGGPGACETIYVTSLKHNGKLYGAVTEMPTEERTTRTP
ncbi:MAG TPA: hypothetical protein PK961_03795 [bacterium]|nr:hypothetical protein [bacterium]